MADSDDFAELEARFAEIEARLGPRIFRPLSFEDATSPSFRFTDPLAETGVTDQRDQLAARLRALFVGGSAADRDGIRALFVRFKAVRWAMWPHTREAGAPLSLRDCLIHLAMTDGSGDYRDDLVALSQICATALKAGFDIKPALSEVSALAVEPTRSRILQMMDVRLR